MGVKAQTHGLTLDARFALADLLRTDVDLQITANLTRNWSRVASVPGPDDRLADQTPLSGNVGLHWQASKRFSSSVDYSYSYSGGGTNRLSAEWASKCSMKRDCRAMPCVDAFRATRSDPFPAERDPTPALLTGSCSSG